MTDAEIFKLAVEVSNEEPELCARLAVEFQRVKESAYNAGLSAGIVAGADAEREACAKLIESYPIPVGNSPAGEMACEWTYAALREVCESIRARIKND